MTAAAHIHDEHLRDRLRRRGRDASSWTADADLPASGQAWALLDEAVARLHAESVSSGGMPNHLEGRIDQLEWAIADAWDELTAGHQRTLCGLDSRTGTDEAFNRCFDRLKDRYVPRHIPPTGI